MANPWIMKMEQFTRFSDDERQVLDRQARAATAVPAGGGHHPGGDHPNDCHLVLSGSGEENLISIKGKTLTIPDPERLKGVAGFNPNYLHLDRAQDKRDGIADLASDLV